MKEESIFLQSYSQSEGFDVAPEEKTGKESIDIKFVFPVER